MVPGNTLCVDLGRCVRLDMAGGDAKYCGLEQRRGRAVPGFVIIAAITIALLGWKFNADFGQWPVIILAAVVAGAYAGFLPWNWYPQKNYAGVWRKKSSGGFFLGVLAIMSGAKVGAMMLVLGIPFIDAALVIIKRLREGRSPVWGGRTPAPLLAETGVGKRRIALFYWMAAALMAVAVLRLNSEWKYFTMATAILVIGE